MDLSFFWLKTRLNRILQGSPCYICTGARTPEMQLESSCHSTESTDREFYSLLLAYTCIGDGAPEMQVNLVALEDQLKASGQLKESTHTRLNSIVMCHSD